MSQDEELEKRLRETLDKIFTKLKLIEARKNGINIFSESKPSILQLTEAIQAIQALYRTREATLIREARIDLWKEVVGSINIPAYRNKAVARVLIPMYRERLRELTNQQ